MFSRWYSWKISHLVLNNNHSPTLIIMGWTTYVIHTGIFYEKLYNGGNFSTIWQNKTHFHIILSDGWKISAIIKFSMKKKYPDVRCPPCYLIHFHLKTWFYFIFLHFYIFKIKKAFLVNSLFTLYKKRLSSA